MPSTNQKRIEELEAELKSSQAQAEQLQMQNYQLTHCLQEIAHNMSTQDGEELREYAEFSLSDTGFEAKLQQRDLNIAYLTIKRLRFPSNVRKQWSGDEVQNWIEQYAEVLKQRALAHQEDKLDKKETLQ